MHPPSEIILVDMAGIARDFLAIFEKEEKWL